MQRRYPKSSVLLLGTLLLGLVLTACQSEPELTGTEMDGRTAADFTLVDHNGETFQSSELRGKAVALTFVFTNCPDICPLIAQRLRMAYDELPESTRENIAMVAISVDPARDTPEAMRSFSEKHGLTDISQWHALTGDRATLEEVWSNYYISPGMQPAIDHDHGDDHENEAESADDSTAQLIGHTDAIFMIDPDGAMRVLMRSDAEPEKIADNLRALAP